MDKFSNEVKRLVERLANNIELRKQLEKSEKADKEALKELVGDDQAAVIGNYVVSVSVRTRMDFDKEKLAKKLGDLSKYQVKSEYRVLDVKLASK